MLKSRIMLPCQQTEAGGQVNDIAATGQRNNKKRAWRQLWPKTKSESQKGSINNGYNNNNRHRRWWAKSGHFDFRKIYREPLFLCVAVLVLFHLLSHTHIHTHYPSRRLPAHKLANRSSKCISSCGPLANTFIYELEKHWLNKSNSPGQKNSDSRTVFYAFLCSKRYSATSTKIQDTFVVMAAIYEYTWKYNHNNAYWNSYLASSSSPFCI